MDHVALPAWASTAEEFISYQRRALESETVSATLHHWIDLIWGFKQTGVEAVEAANIFFYLTYEGRVDLEAVLDPAEREALRTQVACFGQTPPELFTSPHPPRRAAMPMLRPVHPLLRALSPLLSLPPHPPPSLSLCMSHEEVLYQVCF